MYSINKISIDKAISVWNNSPNAHAYNNPTLLKNFKNIKIFAVSKGDEIFCCWPIQVDNLNNFRIPDMFYYFGPFWSKKINNLPVHSWLKYSSEVYGLFLKKFTKEYKNMNFELHYSLQDVRIFDWWNYNYNTKRFKIHPRYTALIDDLKNKMKIK